MTNCKNCNHPVTENFCSHCGHPVRLKRIDSHYIVHEITHVLHLEKGIFYTVKELLIKPGHNVKTFIAENRSRLVKPVIFIIITSLIYSIITHLFHVEHEYVSVNGSEETKKTSFFAIMSWIQSHYGYANIMMGVFIAFWLKLFFKNYNYNIFEIVILLCFVIGIGMLVMAVFAIIEALTHIQLAQLSGILFFVYATWAIGQFFDQKKISSYLKALAAYIIGLTTFFIGAFFLGLIIDLLFKQ